MLGRLIDHNTDNHHSNDRINKNLQYLDKYGNRTIFSYGITLVYLIDRIQQSIKNKHGGHHHPDIDQPPQYIGIFPGNIVQKNISGNRRYKIGQLTERTLFVDDILPFIFGLSCYFPNQPGQTFID